MRLATMGLLTGGTPDWHPAPEPLRPCAEGCDYCKGKGQRIEN